MSKSLCGFGVKWNPLYPDFMTKTPHRSGSTGCGQDAPSAALGPATLAWSRASQHRVEAEPWTNMAVLVLRPLHKGKGRDSPIQNSKRTKKAFPPKHVHALHVLRRTISFHSFDPSGNLETLYKKVNSACITRLKLVTVALLYQWFIRLNLERVLFIPFLVAGTSRQPGDTPLLAHPQKGTITITQPRWSMSPPWLQRKPWNAGYEMKEKLETRETNLVRWKR